MAKQNVTFIERHLEKIVVGVTGAVLVATAALYLVGTPHQAEVQGEPAGPQSLYEMIRKQADATRESMKREDASRADGTSGPVAGTGPDPFEGLKLPKEFAVSPAPLNPPVPEVQGAQRGRIHLAEILPPTAPKVSTGMANLKLPPPTIGEGTAGATPGAADAISEDHSWAVVVAAISRKAQRAKFDRARYTLERQSLIVAGVEAERQERLSDGQWGASTVVTGYSEMVIPVRRSAEMVLQDDGTRIIPTDAMTAIEAYRLSLASSAIQSRLMRPPFQQLLDTGILWQVPAEITAGDGTVLKLTDFGATVEESSKKPGAANRPVAGPGAGGVAAGVPANATPQEMLRQAIQLSKEKKYLEAEELLNKIDTTANAPENIKASAKKELDKIRANVEQLRREVLRKEQAASAANDLGPEEEPLWMTDVSVTPGKTYRYRVRLLAFNPYVGFIMQLENPQDAARIVTESPWSAWSDPIHIKAAVHLFFTSLKEDTGTANLVIRAYENGSWRSISKTGKNSVSVGDPVTYGSGPNAASYGNALVADLVAKITLPDRVTRGGEITYQNKAGASALYLITADGQVEERTTTGDAQRKSQLEREIQEEKKRIEAAAGDTQVRPVDPGHDQPVRPGGGLGPMEDPLMPRR